MAASASSCATFEGESEPDVADGLFEGSPCGERHSGGGDASLQRDGDSTSTPKGEITVGEREHGEAAAREGLRRGVEKPHGEAAAREGLFFGLESKDADAKEEHCGGLLSSAFRMRLFLGDKLEKA